MDVGVGGRDVLRSHSRVTRGPRTGKFTNLNVGGWKSVTLEEVKEALLPPTHTLTEHVRV